MRYDICIPPYSSREKEKLVHRFKNFFNLLFFRRKIEFSRDARDPSSFTQPPFHSFLPLRLLLSRRTIFIQEEIKKEIGNFETERGKGWRVQAGRERERKIGNIGVFPGIKIRKLQCLNRAGFNETISRVFPTSMQLHDNGRA